MALGHVHIIFLLSSLTVHESIGHDEIGSGSGKTSPFSPCSSRSSSAFDDGGGDRGVREMSDAVC